MRINTLDQSILFYPCIDYEEVVKLDPSITVAVEATRTLPPRIKEQQEREKEEMMGMLFYVSLFFLLINIVLYNVK